MSRCRILSVSFDTVVSRHRSEALTTAGYDVVATTDVKEASQLLDEEEFDLLLIGHRFTAQQKRDLTLLAKKRQPLPVLLVCGASTEPALAVEGRVYALQGMEGVLAEVAKLLPLTRAA